MDKSEHATQALFFLNGDKWSLVTLTPSPAPDVSGYLF